jgi:hypothetical protein
LIEFLRPLGQPDTKPAERKLNMLQVILLIASFLAPSITAQDDPAPPAAGIIQQETGTSV